jgi:hypothetical protein
MCRGKCWVFSAAEAGRVANFVKIQPIVTNIKKDNRVAWCSATFLGIDGDTKRMFHDNMMALRPQDKKESKPPLPQTVHLKPPPLPKSHDISRMYDISAPPVAAVVCYGARAYIGWMIDSDFMAILGEVAASDMASYAARRYAFTEAKLIAGNDSWIPAALRVPVMRVTSQHLATEIGIEGCALNTRIAKAREAIIGLRTPAECTPWRINKALTFLATHGEDLRAACGIMGALRSDDAITFSSTGAPVSVSKGPDGKWQAARCGAITDGAEIETDGPPAETAWEALVSDTAFGGGNSQMRAFWNCVTTHRGCEYGGEAYARGALVTPAAHPAFSNGMVTIRGGTMAVSITWT